MPKVAIIGTTAWGITLAMVLARKEVSVSLWARSEEEVSRLAQDKERPNKLAGITFPPKVSLTSSIDEAMEFIFVDICSATEETELELILISSEEVAMVLILLEVCSMFLVFSSVEPEIESIDVEIFSRLCA